MGDNFVDDETTPAPDTPRQAEPTLLPDALVGPVFIKTFFQAYHNPRLWAQKIFVKIMRLTEHLNSSPETEISKIVCFGLGSVWTANTGTGKDEAETVRRTILRHIIAVQLGIIVSKFSSLQSRKSQGLEQVEIVLCDAQYTDKDTALLGTLKFFKGPYTVRFNTVDLGIKEVDKHSFVIATTSDIAVRRHILSCGVDVPGMLWTDHAYDDAIENNEDKLEGDTRSLMKQKYRRFAFPQTSDGLKQDNIGVKLALYFLRDTVLTPTAEEQKLLAVLEGHNQKTNDKAKKMVALRVSPNKTTEAPRVSPKVICQEFLKVLGRTEVEQPMICFNLCACGQFWRYQHYFFRKPALEWGIRKIVCFGLGSFKNITDKGGPFVNATEKHTYRDVIRNAKLLSEFNAKPVDRHDALQVMLRHIAAIEIASMLKFSSSKRGVEHDLIKHYFKRLTTIQDIPGSVEEIDEKIIRKLEKGPPTAGYGGDEDMTDIPVYLYDPEYTEEDKDALGCLSEILETAHQPPIKVVHGQDQVCRLVDEHTLVYSVDPDFPVRSMVLATREPAAMIWRAHGINPDVGDVLTPEVLPVLNNYEEFKLDQKTAPHTIGSSHMYIRRDIAGTAEANGIVPPYPVNFPHGHPHDHGNWYLNKVKGAN